MKFLYIFLFNILNIFAATPDGTTVLTQTQITEILNAANFVRSSINKGSLPYQDTNFPMGSLSLLTWNSDYQILAQTASDSCLIVTSDALTTSGYTINPIINYASLNLTTLFRRTFQESRNYLLYRHIANYQPIKISLANLLADQTYSNDWAASLIYTATTQIGCGVNKCIGSDTKPYYYFNCLTNSKVQAGTELYAAIQINSISDLSNAASAVSRSSSTTVLNQMNDIRRSFMNDYTGLGKIYQLGSWWPNATTLMPDLIWDSTLAQIAQASIDSCIGNFQSNTYGIAYFKSYSTVSESIIQSQWIEQGKYAYNVDKNNKNIYNYQTMFKAKDFTQIIWQQTTNVGCGQTLSGQPCRNYDYEQTPYYAIRCLFTPKGNIDGLPIYS